MVVGKLNRLGFLIKKVIEKRHHNFCPSNFGKNHGDALFILLFYLITFLVVIFPPWSILKI